MALVPAVLGLWGNASFSQAVPVRVPSSATSSQPATSPGENSRHDPLDDRSVEPRRHRDGLDDSRATRPAGRATDVRDDRGRHESSEPETGDDRGGGRAGPDVQSDHRSGADDGTEQSGSSQHRGDLGGDDHGGDPIGHGSDG
jgi:hypothetical protein